MINEVAKGPEPETVVTGVIDDVNYAFIALERISGIMVYDLSNPEKPEFVTLFLAVTSVRILGA